jgi:hypothetical protein
MYPAQMMSAWPPLSGGRRLADSGESLTDVSYFVNAESVEMDVAMWVALSCDGVAT